MNLKNLFLLTITSSAIVFSGAAFSADAEKSQQAGDVKAEKQQTPANKRVKPHNHMRDAKGMGVVDKSDSTAETAKPSAGVKPHNHMRDAKGMGMGMGMADKSDSKSETAKPAADQK